MSVVHWVNRSVDYSACATAEGKANGGAERMVHDWVIYLVEMSEERRVES